VVTCQPEIWRRAGKIRRPKTGILSTGLYYAANSLKHWATRTWATCHVLLATFCHETVATASCWSDDGPYLIHRSERTTADPVTSVNRPLCLSQNKAAIYRTSVMVRDVPSDAIPLAPYRHTALTLLYAAVNLGLLSYVKVCIVRPLFLWRTAPLQLRYASCSAI